MNNLAEPQATPLSVLREVYGYSDFRGDQAAVIDHVCAGEDALVLMPTGGGKSICYQIPSFVLPGMGIVVSPLIALMRDQVRALTAVGIQAAYLNSTLSPSEQRDVMDLAEHGNLDLLYIAPERLASGSALNMLRRIGVSMIAVDEAHCVSQWGHDFRPDYLRIGELRRALGVPLAAFTATADVETRTEIVEKLFDGTPPQTFLRGFDRPNIHLAFTEKNSPRQQVMNFVAPRKA